MSEILEIDDAPCVYERIIHLTGDEVKINLDGYHTTIGELKECVIDSIQYRKFLKDTAKYRR